MAGMDRLKDKGASAGQLTIGTICRLVGDMGIQRQAKPSFFCEDTCSRGPSFSRTWLLGPRPIKHILD
jgi:hypothetical protein